MKDIKEIQQMAKRMRLRAMDMALAACEQGRLAHFGGALSCMEILAVLFGHEMRFDIKNIDAEERDRFFVSKAHCVLAQYTAMAEVGLLADEELNDYMVDGNPLMGYPRDAARALEYSGGSLGMAFSFAVGVAIALKRKKSDSKVYVLVGDGECDEGLFWETVMSAANYELDNMVLIVDRNHLQLDGDTEDVMQLGDMGKKLESFGWSTVDVNGHSVEELINGFQHEHKNRPLAIVADTIKGKGVSFMEGKKEWHQGSINKSQYEQAVQELKEGM